jgi:hypothetical protein
MGWHHAEVALYQPSPSIEHALALVMEKHRGYWWDWYAIGPLAGWDKPVPMVFIDGAGHLHSQHRPNDIAADGELGSYLPEDEWNAELADLRDSHPDHDIVLVRCKW